MIMKKFLERCGFRLEAILRKHRIVSRRNRDTAVYVVLNSDWPEIEFRLKKFLGIPLRKVVKVAEIAPAKDVLSSSQLDSQESCRGSATRNEPKIPENKKKMK